MRKKVLLFTAFILASLIVIVSEPVCAAPTYDWTHYDPKDDVMRVRTGGDFKFASWDNVEITKMTSTFIDNDFEKDQIQMKMTVEGIIQNNEDYKYVFLVKADNVDYIFLAWNLGEPVGWKYEDPLPMSNLLNGITATGAGTDTLTFTYNADAIGPPDSSFTFSGAAVYSEGDYQRYLDLAKPDKLVLITEPSDGSTVSGDVTVRGVIMDSIDSQPNGNVEIDIDNSDNWQSVSGSDPWSYQLDTTSFIDGTTHKISVRVGNDPVPNAYDDITITVDQNTGNYKSLPNSPVVHVGDWYHYEAMGETNIAGINLDVSNSLDSRVAAIETLDGTEVFRVESHSEGEQELGYIYYNNTVDKTTWKETDGLGTIEDYTDSTVYAEFKGTTTVETWTEYTGKPLENHNEFDVTVGWINKWTLNTHFESDSQTSHPGEEPTSNPHVSEDLTVSGECLEYLTSHSVHGNTFSDVYVIRTYYENPGISIVEYYSEELGVPVQIDTFDPSREPLFSLGLESWHISPFSINIDDVRFDPNPPVAESSNKIIVSIANVGVEEATDFELTIKEGDKTIKTETVTSISTDSTEDVSIDWTPNAEGNHTIYITATHDGETLASKTVYVDVGPPGEDDGLPVPMELLLVLIIIIIVVVVLVMVILKKRGAGEPTPKEAEAPSGTVQPQAAAAPVTVATEPEPQVTPATTQAQMLSESIQCPSCKQGFTVNYESKPVRVKCPNCGTEGVLN
jgi:hypothetical protein